jgi:predicted RNase H-like HicB family nuclease
MEILQKPTYQEVCDLVQAITGSYESISCDLDASFANKITGKTSSKFETPILMALQVYQDIVDVYFWSHMLDCPGCNTAGRDYGDFWGQYYAYAKMGCTKKKHASEWPEGSAERSTELMDRRKEYRAVFPHVCELYASGMSYEEARASVEKSASV